MMRPRDAKTEADLLKLQTDNYPHDPEAAEARIATMREALIQGAQWFEDYARLHKAKDTNDGWRKAATNEGRAKYLRDAAAIPARPTSDPHEGMR